MKELAINALFLAFVACLAFCLIAIVAVHSEGEQQPQIRYATAVITNSRPSTVDRQPSMVDRGSSTVADAPFVGSSIKAVYHRAGCRYARMMEHSRGYASQYEASMDGKIPCKVCMPVVEVARKGHD